MVGRSVTWLGVDPANITTQLEFGFGSIGMAPFDPLHGWQLRGTLSRSRRLG
jgi:hypothetical protein